MSSRVGASPVPSPEPWALPCEMLPVELVLAGDVLVMEHGTTHRVTGSIPTWHRGQRVQMIRLENHTDVRWEHGLYVHVRRGEPA